MLLEATIAAIALQLAGIGIAWFYENADTTTVRRLAEVNAWVAARTGDGTFEKELNDELSRVGPQEVQVFGPHFAEWLGDAHKILNDDAFDFELVSIEIPESHEAWFDEMLAEAGLQTA